MPTIDTCANTDNTSMNELTSYTPQSFTPYSVPQPLITPEYITENIYSTEQIYTQNIFSNQEFDTEIENMEMDDLLDSLNQFMSSPTTIVNRADADDDLSRRLEVDEYIQPVEYRMNTETETLSTMSTETLNERIYDEETKEPEEQLEIDPTTDHNVEQRFNNVLEWLNNDSNIPGMNADYERYREYGLSIQNQYLAIEPRTVDGVLVDTEEINPWTHLLLNNKPYAEFWINIYNCSTGEESHFCIADNYSLEFLEYIKECAERKQVIFTEYPLETQFGEHVKRSYWLKIPSMKYTSTMMEHMARCTRNEMIDNEDDDIFNEQMLEYYKRLYGVKSRAVGWDLFHWMETDQPIIHEHIQKVWFYQNDVPIQGDDNNSRDDNDEEESIPGSIS